MAALNRVETHRTADGQPVKIGAELCFRYGGKNPRTGRWRVRRMKVVEFVGAAKVRLFAPIAGKAVRECADLYADRNLASGRSFMFDNPLA